MRVLALTRYERLGSSSRVRFYQYFPYLQAHGVEIAAAPFFDDGYVRRLYAGQRASLTEVVRGYAGRLSALLRSGSFDLLWIEKELFPWLPGWFEDLFHRLPYAVDYDDAVFHRYDLHRSRLVRALLGRKIDRVMRGAALVVAGNDYLAERARAAGARRVECLPSVVDVRQYALAEPQERSPFRIGWIGAPVTAPYLDLVREAVGELGRESAVQLVLIGAGPVGPFGAALEILPWSESLERQLGQRFDAGIMPLVDGPFERGKCGYKLVQYMAGSLPVIASPVGVNPSIVEPGVNGYLAASSAEWLTAFRALRDSLETRKVMGGAGRRKAEQMYNLQGTAPKLLDLLASARER